MALLEAVLARVADHERVTERMEKSTALRDLVDGYHNYARDDATLVNITTLTTGAELKEALRQLKPEAQLTLLKKYSDTVHGVVPPAPPAATVSAEHIEQAEERKNRNWFMRLCMLVISSIVMLVSATFVSIVVKNHGGDAGVFASTLTNIIEIAKLVFGAK